MYEMRDNTEYAALRRSQGGSDLRAMPKMMDMLTENRNEGLPNLIPTNLELSDEFNEQLMKKSRSRGSQRRLSSVDLDRSRFDNAQRTSLE